MIIIEKNRNLIDDIFNYPVICFNMGINNGMSNGYLKYLSVNFPYLKEKEASHKYGDKHKYGNIYTISEEKNDFCVMYTIRNGNIDPEYLKSCIDQVKRMYGGYKIATFWNINDKSFEILKNEFENDETELHVYEDAEDFNLTYYKKRTILYNKYKNNEITKDELLSQKDNLEFERKNGKLRIK